MNKFAILLTFVTIFFMTMTLVTSTSGFRYSKRFNKRQSSAKGKLISNNAAFTYYWIVFESDYKTTQTVDIKTCGGKKLLANVNSGFAKDLRTEGTGVAKTGKVYNLGDCDCGSGFSCFVELDKTKFPFGSTSNDTPLDPFTTIASNDIRQGTKVYVPKLDGIVLPNGLTHNGCVKVDDVGYSFGNNHIDWFVVRESNYNILDKKYPFTKVEVYEGPNCILKNYK